MADKAIEAARKYSVETLTTLGLGKPSDKSTLPELEALFQTAIDSQNLDISLREKAILSLAEAYALGWYR